MGAHLKYLSYVLRHKWFVFVAGLRVGAPLWRLLIHDWSKFLPSEWSPYVAHFYSSPHAGGRCGGLKEDCPPCARARDSFDRAWLHHQHANPHHWQHQVLREDSGATKPLPMPEPLVREMAADWMGAGRAITGRWDAGEWYAQNRGKMLLHPETRVRIEALLVAACRG